MEDKLKVFLESGKLEAYIYGYLEPEAQEEVMHFINKYPEVNEEYVGLQNQLENISRQQSIKAPDGLKSKILESLPEKAPQVVSIGKPWAKYMAIAGIAASLIFAGAWFNTNAQLQKEIANHEIFVSECEQKEKEIESQRQRIEFLNSGETQRFEIQGNQLAPDFKMNIFLNESLEKVILKPVNKINLPKNKCLQLWGDLDGEMIPIAVLNDLDKEDYDLGIFQNFASLNITIEERTADGKGQDHPDVSQLIGSVAI